MKRMYIVLSLVVLASQLYSQKISIRQRNETIGNGSHNALVATIYEADLSYIEKEWKSLMKSYDAKVTMGGEIFADNAKFKGFDNSCDVYARIKNNSDTEKEIMVAVDLGGTFLSSSHPAQLKRIENILYDFAVRITKDAISTQLKEAEKIQKKMLKDQENLADDNEQFHKDIENYKNRISQAEKAIAENEKAQDLKKQEIEKQKNLTEAIREKLGKVK